MEKKFNFWDEHDKLHKTPKWKRQKRVKVFEYFLEHSETTIEEMQKQMVQLQEINKDMG